ncbi:Transcriptional regulatory protein RcsB [Paraburkholderia caffeinitolerans]|uniref:Transcriptional regulatory protein RcsB n=1 Tax=Paraburkholderia caffeinitolerans TaxID=1723730 RepID=A0A6J5G9C2_9BURK|nr:MULTISPECIES: response regulator transcription factor [Paraburkholderia]CAB3796233.1 Transcriptional regulatory protein RcsB [Paraburkholderia caffeinitolerans]
MTHHKNPTDTLDRVRIIIADDHPIVRLAVAATFTSLPGYEIVALAKSGLDLLSALYKNHCDLIVTDLAMCWDAPETDGMALIRWLRFKYPAIPVVVFTMTTSISIIRELIQARVAGIVTKDEPLSELTKVCQYAQSGSKIAVSDMVARRLSASAPPAEIKRKLALSRKEREIVQLIARGMSLTEIARRSGRTTSTIGTQKMAAMRKLHLTSNAELIQYAMLHGLASS